VVARAGATRPVTARDEILGRVREALDRTAAAAPQLEPLDPPGPSPLDAGGERARLQETLLELGVEVCDADVTTLPRTIEAICARHAAHRVVVPDDWPPAWTPSGVEVEREGGRAARELGDFDCALTAARLGIAESGTLVLDGGARHGSRLLTLLVELHVCVLPGAAVVDSIDHAMELLAPTPGARGALTFVSGPSATTDIELTRIEGVHGPRRLAVVLLD
jgi:L-lactate dehydrogenase complex protein LldG